MSTTLSYIQENKQRFLDELIDLLKIASISADPAYNQDVLQCADAVAKHLKNAGADNVEICETKGYPVVFGEKILDKNLPTVLVYGHYDVQPADPIELWESGPFEPVVKKTEIHPEGAVFARGAAPNPINVLSKMIGSLIDENGVITVEGFYDNVNIVSPEERAEMNKLKDDPEAFKKEIGLKGVEGEKGYTTLERTSIRPTLDVNGIWGGYIGEGAKTVIPSKAFAKISMRLVPNQTPEEITEKFTKHFEKIAPDSVKVTVTPHHGGMPYVLESNTKEFLAAKKAMEQAFGREVLPFRSGGSIPITALFEQILGVKSVLMGFGLSTDAIHSPNEHFGLYNFYKGIESIPLFFEYYTKG